MNNQSSRNITKFLIENFDPISYDVKRLDKSAYKASFVDDKTFKQHVLYFVYSKSERAYVPMDTPYIDE